jgi:hypothetical protein
VAIVVFAWWWTSSSDERAPTGPASEPVGSSALPVPRVGGPAATGHERNEPIRTVPRRRLSGKVASSDGRALPSATVRVIPQPMVHEVATMLTSLEIETDASGRFGCEIAAGASYFVGAVAPGFFGDPSSVGPNDDPATVDLVLRCIVAYGLELHDATCALPVAWTQGASVATTYRGRARSVMESASPGLIASARASGLSGEVVATRLAQRRLFVPSDDDVDGELSLLIRLPGYADVDVTIAATTLETAISNPNAVMMVPLSGFATTQLSLMESGSVARGAQFVVIRSRDKPDDVTILRGVNPAERCGVTLREGHYEAVFSASRFSWSHASTFEVVAGRTNHAVIRMPMSSTIRVSDGGDPLRPVYVNKLSRHGPGGLEEIVSGVWPTTDPDIVFRGLEAGRYQVDAWFVSGSVSATVELGQGAMAIVTPSSGN